MPQQPSYVFDGVAAPPVAAPARDVAPANRLSALVWAFGATVFLSASLLFLVEPMFARMVLPYLGGSPAVWNTCVVFFQAAMLAGYAYAHLLTRHVPLRGQFAIHVTLVAAAAMVLPVVIPQGWMPPVDRTPVPSLLRLLLVTVGAPFFIVSSTAPLLQRWFSQTRDRAASDPYFLYAASNLGSMTALLAYPFVIEPLWSLGQQSSAWTWGYGAFVAAVAGCAALSIRSPNGSKEAGLGIGASSAQAPTRISWLRTLRWVSLALVPSSLMLGVTMFLSTDVATVPLLWVAPLTLYLLSFVIAFSPTPLISQRTAATITTVTMMPVVLTIVTGIELPAWLEMPLHLVAFFGFALMLHGQLAADRPAPSSLTAYYLWISVGGLLGGVFTTLVAPAVFTGVAEYPLMLLAVCALRPVLGREAPPARSYRDLLIPAVLGVLLWALLTAAKGGMVNHTGLSLGFGIMSAFYAASAKTRFRFTAGVAMMLVASLFHDPAAGAVIHAERTFFGVVRVRAEEGARHAMFHGNTMHGEQVLDQARRREPISYYHREGPIGQLIAAVSGRLDGGHVGVVGLGAGALAAYAQPGQQWTFYEIDPAVARVASTPRYFTYLEDCGVGCRVVLGDGRLSVARAEQPFDLLILDAFSSDAIPVHLMTREALQTYLSKLSVDGVLAFHISNRHLDLRPVLGALAVDLGLTAYGQIDSVGRSAGRTSSSWLMMARDPRALSALAGDSRWTRPRAGSDLWTDDYSNVFKALIAFDH